MAVSGQRRAVKHRLKSDAVWDSEDSEEGEEGEGEKNKATLQNFAGRKKGVGAREKISQNMAAGGFCVSDCSSPPSSFMLPLPPVSPFCSISTHTSFPPKAGCCKCGLTRCTVDYSAVTQKLPFAKRKKKSPKNTPADAATLPQTHRHTHINRLRTTFRVAFIATPNLHLFQWQEPALKLDIRWKECTPPPPEKQKHKLRFINQESKQRADIPPKTMQLMRNRLPSALENLPDQRWLHNCLIKKYSKLVVFLQQKKKKKSPNVRGGEIHPQLLLFWLSNPLPPAAALHFRSNGVVNH